MQLKPLRAEWEPGFPPVWIHAPEASVSGHPWYEAARSGDVDAAALLVADTCNEALVQELAALGAGKRPILVGVHARESAALNVIPAVFAAGLAVLLDWETDTELVQANLADPGGASAVKRLARQAVFAGPVEAGRNYLIVDEFNGQGGTIANLRGHIVHGHGVVLGATVLTGKAYAAILVLGAEAVEELRAKYGQIETWWRAYFGFGFECLTAPEARYLINAPDTESILAKIEELGRA